MFDLMGLVLGTGIRVPESVPVTRVLAGYPGTRVYHITRKIKRYPQLVTLAVKYLGLSATSVSSERIFSKAGEIVNRRRASLKPSILLTCWSSCLKICTSSLEKTKLTQSQATYMTREQDSED
jgi:hypothetical protein